MVESGKVGTHSGTQTSNLRDAFARQKTVAKAIAAFEPAPKGEASIHGQRTHRASGSIYLKQRAKGPVWYWRIRLPHGGEERKAIGPAWTKKGKPAEGYVSRREARARLEERLTDLRRGVGIPDRTGTTFRTAAEDWYSHGTTIGHPTRGPWKPATRRDYRSALDRWLLPAFGDLKLSEIDAARIMKWRQDAMAQSDPKLRLPRRTAAKLSAILHSIFERARKQYGIAPNPLADVDRVAVTYNAEVYDFYSPEEVWALVREAETPTQPADPNAEQIAGSKQDAAIYLTAAFTGLRLGELLALRVRDVDFEAEAIRVMGSIDLKEGRGTPKSGKGRTVPMVPDVAEVLARQLQRDRFLRDDDPVFLGYFGDVGESAFGDAPAPPLDGSALRRRFRAAQKRAGLRPIRFHDLRHTFGSLAITQGTPLEVQHWMGHADGRTTARYLHYRSRADEARRLATAFRAAPTRGAAKASTTDSAATEPAL